MKKAAYAGFLIWVLGLCAGFSPAAAGETGGPPVLMERQNSVFIPPSDPHIQYSGRFDFSDPLAPRFDWPAVSIAAVFQGTRIGILLEDGHNNYDAFIDGELQQVITTDIADQYTVGGLESGTHHLLLVKRTEAYFGIATFKGLLLEKGMSLLKPPPRPTRRIEIVGDSLACGAEVEDNITSCEPSHFRPTANSYLAFGPLASRALKADYRVTSYSATGILKHVGMASVPMPAYYPRVLANLETPAMDPQQWIPDAVIIELGGNDFFSGGTAPSGDEFEDAYKKFIAVIRTDYPLAHIFCQTFGTAPPAGNLIQDVVSQENKAGDNQVGLIVLDYPSAHLTGCYHHFDQEGQQLVADELTKELRKDMGWYEGVTVQDQRSTLAVSTEDKKEMDAIPPPPDWDSIAKPAPIPSFRGKEEGVYFVNAQAGVTLAGTLVLPEGRGPFPAVLYLEGGGPWGRNPGLFKSAEGMAQKGIAMLIYDKRGIGQSTGDFKSAHFPEFQQDAVAGFEFLKSRPEIDPKKVGFIGHSEGGMITEMIAAEHPDVAFAVLMAAPGLRGDRVRALQGIQESKAYQVDEKVLADVEKMQAKAFPLLETETDPEVSRPQLHAILTEGYAKLDENEKMQLREVLEADNATLEEKAVLPSFRHYLLWDPAPYLRKIQCPVLALNGDKDIAVVYPQNLTAIGEALKEGGNKDYTLKVFHNVNHLFLRCVTGAPDEKLPDSSSVPEVQQVIDDWLVKHTQ